MKRPQTHVSNYMTAFFNQLPDEQKKRALIDRKRFIDPAALDIWNGLVKRHHPIDKSRQGNPDAVL